MTEPFLRLAVIGDPIAHSRSPELHAGFLEAAGLAGSYERIRVPAGEGARSIDALRSQGYLGLNVTTPLKEEAFARSERLDAVALATGSVNTLLFSEAIRGFNTDGVGAVGVLAEAGVTRLAGTRILVLGAGPTARSTIAALRAAAAEVWLWHRRAEHAAATARALEVDLFAPGTRVDAVFSALPPHAAPNDPALAATLLETPVFVDANYGERATLAKDLGRSGFDGTHMLEHSARASFEIWRSHVYERTSEAANTA